MSEEIKKKKPLMSFSATKAWKTCGEKHYWQYKKRVKPKQQGASLAFGTAVDLSLGYLLNCIKDGKKSIGLQHFKTEFINNWAKSFDDNKQRFTLTDYDRSLLTDKQDILDIADWEKELGCTTVQAFAAEKQSKYKKFDGNKLKLFNRLCWLSLNRKAPLMLDAFVVDILPKIKKVIAVQHKFQGEIGDIARLGGYIDLICEFEGYDKPVVFDIKTSASFYKADRIMLSDQLLIYLNAVGEDLKTDLVGYIVLLKFMKKNSVCSVCGAKKVGKFRTCNKKIKDKRCAGKWKSSPEGITQVMVEPISDKQKRDGLDSFTGTAQLASLGIRYKDYDRCYDYGLCPYFHLCHHNNPDPYEWKSEEDRKEWEEENKK